MFPGKSKTVATYSTAAHPPTTRAGPGWMNGLEAWLAAPGSGTPFVGGCGNVMNRAATGYHVRVCEVVAPFPQIDAQGKLGSWGANDANANRAARQPRHTAEASRNGHHPGQHDGQHEAAVKETLGWGVIGTGIIAGDFAEALERSSRCRVVNAVGSSSGKGQAFRQRFRLPRSSESIEQLLGDPGVDAVYVATPHPLHEENALACIEAGKPVLCEKPLTMSAASTTRLLDAARARRVFLLEAFMYRCHPVVTDLLGRLRDGAIGKLRHVRSDFAYRAERDAKSRLFAPALGGGAILDIGCYPMSFSRLIAGVAEDAPFAEPVELHGHGFVGPLGADELATALLRFASGMTATLTCAVRHQGGTQTEIFGEEGRVLLPNAWIPGGERHGLEASYTLHRYGEAPEEIRVPARLGVYALEAEWVADSLPALEARWPAMTWADTLGNMRGLDAWLAGTHARQT